MGRMSLLCRLKKLVHKGELEEKDLDRIVIIPKEQEPCEDCISRQAVIDAIEDDNRNGNYSCFASNNDAECFKDVIRSLSSVTPKPKTDVLDKIRAEIQVLRNCSCSCSDGIIDDVEDIIDKYKAEKEE